MTNKISDKIKLLPTASDPSHSHAYGAVKTTNPDGNLRTKELTITDKGLTYIGKPPK